MNTHSKQNHPQRPPFPTELSDRLSSRFGKRFSRGESIRLQHGRDESVHIPALPDGVVFAESTEEVAETVRLCHGYQVPILSLIHISEPTRPY